MEKFCSSNQTILMRCIYSESLLIKHDERSGRVELIKRAIGLNPKVAVAHNKLGNALMDLKRPAEALASYDKAIALKPDYRGGAQQSRQCAEGPQASRGSAGEATTGRSR